MMVDEAISSWPARRRRGDFFFILETKYLEDPTNGKRHFFFDLCVTLRHAAYPDKGSIA